MENDKSELHKDLDENNFSDKEKALFEIKLEHIKQHRALNTKIFFTKYTLLLGLFYFLINFFRDELKIYLLEKITLGDLRIFMGVILIATAFVYLSIQFLFEDNKYYINGLFEVVKQKERKISDYEIPKRKYTDRISDALVVGFMFLLSIYLLTKSPGGSMVGGLIMFFIILSSKRYYAEDPEIYLKRKIKETYNQLKFQFKK